MLPIKSFNPSAKSVSLAKAIMFLPNSINLSPASSALLAISSTNFPTVPAKSNLIAVPNPAIIFSRSGDTFLAPAIKPSTIFVPLSLAAKSTTFSLKSSILLAIDEIAPAAPSE